MARLCAKLAGICDRSADDVGTVLLFWLCPNPPNPPHTVLTWVARGSVLQQQRTPLKAAFAAQNWDCAIALVSRFDAETFTALRVSRECVVSVNCIERTAVSFGFDSNKANCRPW